MPRNTLMDLHNILFEELERLNDESLDNDQLANEVRRAKAIEGVADKITSNTANMLAAMKIQSVNGRVSVPLALMGGLDEL